MKRGQTDRLTSRLYERIGPEGQCFENMWAIELSLFGYYRAVAKINIFGYSMYIIIIFTLSLHFHNRILCGCYLVHLSFRNNKT